MFRGAKHGLSGVLSFIFLAGVKDDENFRRLLLQQGRIRPSNVFLNTSFHALGEKYNVKFYSIVSRKDISLRFCGVLYGLDGCNEDKAEWCGMLQQYHALLNKRYAKSIVIDKFIGEKLVGLDAPFAVLLWRNGSADWVFVSERKKRRLFCFVDGKKKVVSLKRFLSLVADTKRKGLPVMVVRRV